MRRLTVCLTALACVLGLLSAAPSAFASSKPTIALTSAPTRIAANHSWTFGYSAHHLRKHSHVDLQFYGGGGWESITRSTPKSGTFTGTIDTQGPNELGTYVVRVAVWRYGKTVSASEAHTVYAYGTVSFAQLCRGAFRLDKEYCQSGQADTGVGDQTWHYVMDTGVHGADQKSPLFGGPAISCRSITFRYDGNTGEQNTFVLRQVGTKPVTKVSRDDHVQTVTAALTGNKFSVSVNQNDGELFFQWNGHASCYTANGKV